MLHRLTVLAALLLMAASALAQGAGRQFVGPISWPTLRERLTLISPSPAQLERMAAEHDAYLADFEILRDGSIASFLDDTKGLGVLTTSDPEEGRRTIARTDRIRRDIAKIDDALFLQISGVLADTQQAGLERVSQRRQRDRLRVRGTTMITGGVSDIEPRDSIDWAALSDDDRDAIEHMMAVWENRYTTQLEAWSRSQDQAEVAFVEVLSTLNAKQANFSPEAPPSSEEIAELINMFTAAQQEVQEQVAPDIRRIQKHITGGMRSLATLLPDDQRFAAVRSAVKGVRLQNRIPKAVRGARRSGLDAATTEALDQIVLKWEQQAVALLIDAMEAKWRDDQDRTNSVVATDDDGNLSFKLPKTEQQDSVKERWNVKHDAALQSIAALVPDSNADDLIAKGADRDRPSEPQEDVIVSGTVMISSGPGGDDEESVVVMSSTTSSSGGDFGLDRGKLLTIPAIQQRVLDSLARDLKLDEAGQTALTELYEIHDAARLAMETERADERRKIRKKAKKEMEESDQQDQAAMMRIGLLLMEPISRDGLDALDASFFNGVNALAAESGADSVRVVQPWRLSRTRDLSSGGGSLLTGSLDLIWAPDDRWKANLLEVVQDAELSDADYAAARNAMQGWHAEATSGTLDVQKSRDAVNAGMKAMMSGGDGAVSIDMTAAMEVEKLQQKMKNKRTALALLAQATADTISNSIADSARFQRAWLQAAFPKVASGDTFLRLYGHAAQTAALTDDQRAAIAMLRAEHDEAWWAKTEAAIAVMTAAREESANPQEAFYEAQRLRQEVDRHSFARREAALKRLEQLRTILNEQQIAAAGGLEDPAAPQSLALPF